MLVSRTSSFQDAVLLIVALCFHSVFEGIAIGVSPTKSDAWRNLWTIGLHKIFAAVAMASRCCASSPSAPSSCRWPTPWPSPCPAPSASASASPSSTPRPMPGGGSTASPWVSPPASSSTSPPTTSWPRDTARRSHAVSTAHSSSSPCSWRRGHGRRHDLGLIINYPTHKYLFASSRSSEILFNFINLHIDHIFCVWDLRDQ
jgi:hypothetical protein